jgi:hypothetical protein
MMRRRQFLSMLALLAGAGVHASSIAADASAGLFASPVVLQGTLGEARIQMQLRPKPEAGEGIEGDYFVFGRSQKVLLAGETQEDALMMEESENGTDVSGQWEGSQHGDSITGTWTSADGGMTKPFALRVVSSSR